MLKTTKAKTIVHVNQHMIKYNKKHGTEFPVLTVKHRGKTYYAHEVIYHHVSTTYYRPHKPLSCGAVCWVETQGDVTLFDWTAVHQQKHPSIKSERKTVRRLGSLYWINSETSELVKNADEKFDIELGHTISHETLKAAQE
tara:strand:- start:25 stop:447 length:423 start_codon:yes stop_codon:yes gene_type:complete